MEEVLVKDRLRLLLDHFGDVVDPREPAKVKYPLRKVLFLDSLPCSPQGSVGAGPRLSLLPWNRGELSLQPRDNLLHTWPALRYCAARAGSGSVRPELLES